MIGARIKQARTLAGMTQRALAERLSQRGYAVTAAAVSKYETGKSFPPAQFMLLASSELHVRSTYFTHQPERAIRWLSFRKHCQLGKKKQEAIKAYAADLAELHIDLYTLLYPDRPPNMPTPVKVDSLDDAEEVANQLRTQWELGNRPLDNLVQTAEDKGVVVVSVSWDKNDDFDGLSGWCGGHPITVINASRSTDRIRFNLAHEIGHLVMDTEHVREKEEERLAHRFASAFLAPAQHVRQELGHKRNQLDLSEIGYLKRKYGMSMAAWVRRAFDLDIIKGNHYQALNIEISRRGWRRREPIDYLGDEEPLQLKQMAQRAVTEGLMSPDRISRVGNDILEPETGEESTHLTVRDLLAMPQQERQEVIKEAFALAAEEEFEIFEAYEFYEDYDENYNVKEV